MWKATLRPLMSHRRHASLSARKKSANEDDPELLHTFRLGEKKSESVIEMCRNGNSHTLTLGSINQYSDFGSTLTDGEDAGTLSPSRLPFRDERI